MAAILVIRSDDKFSSTLLDAGFEVVNLELVATKPMEDLSELRVKLAKLREYDGIFFTSPVAAQVFVTERKGSNGFYGSVYVLGRRAQHVLEAAGLKVKPATEANTADELLEEFGSGEFTGKRFLFVRGEKSLRTIPESLSSLASVDEVAVYSTVPVDIDRKILENVKSRLFDGKFDNICFFSPSGVERFAELFGDATAKIKAAAIGSSTADAVRKAGFDVDFISPRSNAEDFAQGLIEHIKKH